MVVFIVTHYLKNLPQLLNRFPSAPSLPSRARYSDATSNPGQRAFSRATMNLQSPGPEIIQAFDEAAPMPDLPKPPSPTASVVSGMKTPSTSTNPTRISDASPMYDRAAIARAMVRHEGGRAPAARQKDARTEEGARTLVPSNHMVLLSRQTSNAGAPVLARYRRSKITLLPFFVYHEVSLPSLTALV